MKIIIKKKNQFYQFIAIGILPCITSFIGKLVTVTVAKTGVAWGTGFVSLVKNWVSSFTNLIPEWLIITENGFSLKFIL